MVEYVKFSKLIETISIDTAAAIVNDLNAHLTDLHYQEDNLVVKDAALVRDDFGDLSDFNDAREEIRIELMDVKERIREIACLRHEIFNKFGEKEINGIVVVNSFRLKESINARKDDITITGNKQDSFHPL